MTHALSRRQAIALGAVMALGSGASALRPTPADAQTVPLEMRGYALGDMVLGDPNAPVTIIEYSSLTCGHCANFHTRTLPTIKERYVDTGKARIIMREVYFEQYGLWASMVARCGGQESFFDKIEALFASQSNWVRSNNIGEELQRIARLEGLSQERVQACLTDEELMNRLVTDFMRHRDQDNIRATPTFIINGETFTGDRSVAEFSALIDRFL